jgi:GDP-L-fucose synthase
VKQVVGFQGEIVFDTSKPDGAPRKLMDVCRLRSLGWSPYTVLGNGLTHAYSDLIEKDAAGKNSPPYFEKNRPK